MEAGCVQGCVRQPNAGQRLTPTGFGAQLAGTGLCSRRDWGAAKCLGESRACSGVSQPRHYQMAAGRGLWGFRDTDLTLSPLLQSIQDFHEDLFPDCAGMLPATSAQAWWAGDSQQVSVTRGLSSPVALPGAATAPCPPLCLTTGGEGEPAPRTETHGDLHLPRHRLHPAAGSQHQQHRPHRR